MKIVIAEKPSVGRELLKSSALQQKGTVILEGKGYSLLRIRAFAAAGTAPGVWVYRLEGQHSPMLPAKFKLGIRKDQD